MTTELVFDCQWTATDTIGCAGCRPRLCTGSTPDETREAAVADNYHLGGPSLCAPPSQSEPADVVWRPMGGRGQAVLHPSLLSLLWAPVLSRLEQARPSSQSIENISPATSHHLSGLRLSSLLWMRRGEGGWITSVKSSHLFRGS